MPLSNPIKVFVENINSSAFLKKSKTGINNLSAISAFKVGSPLQIDKAYTLSLVSLNKLNKFF